MSAERAPGIAAPHGESDDLGGGGDSSFSFWTAVSALLAFFLGGLVTGGTTKWDRADDGALHGVPAVGAGHSGAADPGWPERPGAGRSAGRLPEQRWRGSEIPAGPQRDAALEAAQDRAAQALISLFLALAASVAGAVAGSKLWPRRRVDLRDRSWGAGRV